MTFRTARVWQDATEIVATHIRNEWGGTVVPTVPHPRPTEFVVVQRGSGANDGVLDYPQMDIECWSGDPNGSSVDAWALANTVREIVRMSPDSVPGICSADETDATYFPDELTDCPRVLLSFTLVVKPTIESS